MNDYEWAQHKAEEPLPPEPVDEEAEWADQQAAQVLTVQIAEAAPDEEPQSGEATRHIVFRTAADMKPRRIKWLDGDPKGGRIPLGGITLLAGREGIGKSTITYDIIAKVTLGTMPGEYFGTPKGVVVYATEDEWEPVIIPRLIVAGADLKRVHRADAYTADGEKDSIDFPMDLKRLAAMCVKHDVALVVLDPIMSVINGKLDTHVDRDVRKALDPLTSFAGAAGVAVLGLIHVNKSGGNDPLNSVMGSRAFSAVARSVLFCIKVEASGEDSEAEASYLFTHEKCNLGPTMPSKQYEIKAVELPQTEDDGSTFTVWTSKVEWGFYDKRGAREVLENSNGFGSGTTKGGLRQQIQRWLRGREMVPVREIIKEFEGRKIEPGTVSTTLTRMKAAKEVLSPVRGFYSPVTADNILHGEDDE